LEPCVGADGAFDSAICFVVVFLLEIVLSREWIVFSERNRENALEDGIRFEYVKK
jgi:hypothetical protein